MSCESGGQLGGFAGPPRTMPGTFLQTPAPAKHGPEDDDCPLFKLEDHVENAMVPAGADGWVLEAELERMQKHCVFVVNQTLDEARARIRRSVLSCSTSASLPEQGSRQAEQHAFEESSCLYEMPEVSPPMPAMEVCQLELPELFRKVHAKADIAEAYPLRAEASQEVNPRVQDSPSDIMDLQFQMRAESSDTVESKEQAGMSKEHADVGDGARISLSSDGRGSLSSSSQSQDAKISHARAMKDGGNNDDADYKQKRTRVASMVDQAEQHRRSEMVKATKAKLSAVLSDDQHDILKMVRHGQFAHVEFSTEGGFRPTIHRILTSVQWDLFIASMIVTNAIFMGVQIDWAARNIYETTTPTEQYVIGYLYTAIFAVELVFRLIDEGISFFSFWNHQVHWNYLDVFIVTASLTEVYVEYQLMNSEKEVDGSKVDQFKIVRLIRISRLMRIFRLARILQFIRPLRMLVYSIVGTLQSVFWALLLMVLFIYVFGMILTQAVSEYTMYIGETDDQQLDPMLVVFWKDVPTSMLSLFKSIAGGISWHEVQTPLQALSPMWQAVFLFYILFLYFAVLNVITGVFVESAMQSARSDQEMVMQEAVQNKMQYIQKLTKLFNDIDEDGSKEITLQEMEDYMNNEMSGAFFEFLELEVKSAGDIIKLIDFDGSEGLSVGEFIDGVCRLRGPAKALDIAQISFETRAFQDWVYQSFQVLAQYMEATSSRDTAVGPGHQPKVGNQKLAKLASFSFPPPERLDAGYGHHSSPRAASFAARLTARHDGSFAPAIPVGHDRTI